MTIGKECCIICKSRGNTLDGNAAIAQPVERILGKDEVASSNLASSSIKNFWLDRKAASFIYAAIAQPVERILGKDEVASSNLASSSIEEPQPFGCGSFII